MQAAFPSSVLGPVESPPCNRHRVPPATGCFWHRASDLVLARQSFAGFCLVSFVLIMALVPVAKFAVLFQKLERKLFKRRHHHFSAGP